MGQQVGGGDWERDTGLDKGQQTVGERFQWEVGFQPGGGGGPPQWRGL